MKKILILLVLLAGCVPFVQTYGIHGDRCDGCGRIIHPEPWDEEEGEGVPTALIAVGATMLVMWFVFHDHESKTDSIQ